MSTNDYAQMSTDELIRRFIDLAKRTGTLWKPNLELMRRREDWLKQTGEMHALAAELSARRPIAKLRRLMEDDDVNVRGWAAGQFSSADPEWSNASHAGLCANMTTRQMLDLCRRAVEPPPTQPPVAALSTEKLAARFEEMATREYGVSHVLFPSDMAEVDTRDRIVFDLCDIKQELEARNALATLLPLLDHAYRTVRGRAAWACLSVAPERAVPILEELSKPYNTFDLGYANRALEQWRKTMQ